MKREKGGCGFWGAPPRSGGPGSRCWAVAVAFCTVGALGASQSPGYPYTDEPTAAVAQSRSEATPGSRPSAYLLGPDDAVAIRVVGHEEFSGAAVVRPDGCISAPGLGSVSASGRSAEALAEVLAGKLKRWFRDPIVTVTVTQFRSRGDVFVLGQVTRPNPYPYRPGLTVTEALVLAGGPTPDADLAHATLLRAADGEERSPERIDLSSLARAGEAAPHVLLERGDMLILPQVRRPKVSVLGEVQKQGTYEVTETARVLEAIQLAQGPRPSANLKAATLTREGQTRPLDMQALLRGGDTSLNLLLQDGDTIFVPENRMKVYILGEVARPDVVVLPEGATLLDALAAAGGHTRDADLKQVRVARRKSDGQPEVQTLDLTRLVASGTSSAGRPKAVVPPALAEGDLLFVPSRTRKKSVSDYLPFLYPIELLTRVVGG
jgi:polysaccharide export outer membrane protein